MADLPLASESEAVFIGGVSEQPSLLLVDDFVDASTPALPASFKAALPPPINRLLAVYGAEDSARLLTSAPLALPRQASVEQYFSEFSQQPGGRPNLTRAVSLEFNSFLHAVAAGHHHAGNYPAASLAVLDASAFSAASTAATQALDDFALQRAASATPSPTHGDDSYPPPSPASPSPARRQPRPAASGAALAADAVAGAVPRRRLGRQPNPADREWTKAQLSLSTRDLNVYIRDSHMPADAVARLKAARRRLKNRNYAHRSRQNRRGTPDRDEEDDDEDESAN